ESGQALHWRGIVRAYACPSDHAIVRVRNGVGGREGILVKVQPLSDKFGAAIRGLDLTGPLSEGDARAIAGALYQHAVVCIPGQDLEPAQLQDFGARFGTPIHHVEEDLRLDGTPGVMSLSNADGRPARQRNGGAFWHTDLVFTEEPASVTMLRAVAVPKVGGETLFADQFAAYDALSDKMKALIGALVAAHCYEGRTDGSMPTVHHPLVRPHPVTGRKALYGAAGTGIGIAGLPEDEARCLLDELADHATAEEFVYRHFHRVGDVVMWDNAATLHSGPVLDPARGSDDARVMHRVSVRGWPAAGSA
ncbi:MAG: TauD/TfdA family dioxygenase, partial [Pseudomonadota bacterium]